MNWLPLSLEDTRKVHLNNLLLIEPVKKRKEVDIIRQLGFLQLDTIYVTARSQDLVLHSRSTNYKEEQVWKFQDSRKLFEGFAHARSLIPVEEFPYYYRKMLSRREKRPKWFDMVDDAEELVEQVLELIKDHGEVTTKDLASEGKIKSRWSSQNKRILDYLARTGHIQVSRREKFSTVYFKLLEDVIIKLPEEDEIPDRLEVFWHDIFKTLKIHGLVPFHRLLHYLYNQKYFEHEGKRKSPRKLVKDAIKSGRIEEHEVGGTDTKYYSVPNYLDTLDIPELDEKQTFLLSPFDCALWSRESLQDQYNFSYKFEAYTPEKDRIHGFYSLPILYGTNFVGRVDPKIDRKSGILYFKHWVWEDNFRPQHDFWDKLSLSVNRFIEFHQASDIDWGDLNQAYQKELTQRRET